MSHLRSDGHGVAGGSVGGASMSAAAEHPEGSAAASGGRTSDGGTRPAARPVPASPDPPAMQCAPSHVQSSTGWGADPSPDRPAGASGTIDAAALTAACDLMLCHRLMCEVLRSLGLWQRVIGPSLTQHIGYHVRRAAECLEQTFGYCSCHREKCMRGKRCERCGTKHAGGGCVAGSGTPAAAASGEKAVEP